jgi:hypothetical protein
MKTPINFSFEVSASHNNSGIEISAKLDDLDPVIFAVTNDRQVVQFIIDDDVEKDHTLVIEMRGKTPQHTKVDDSRNIIDDVLILLENFWLDDFNLESILWDKAQYIHDHNGTQPMAIHKFFGPIGCNGIVKISFTTPAYIWLLEHV